MSITMRDMLEAGVHFGHQTRFWSPQMAPFIFGSRNKIHIINLEHTLAQYNEALTETRKIASRGGTILFVSTKRQAREIIAEEAARADCPYVNQRWLGGMLTNFKTIKSSVKRLKDADAMVESGEIDRLPKKEALHLRRKMQKLQKAMGGVKEMNKLPDALFIIDVGYHHIAVVEAQKLGIPIIAVVDSNHSPDGINHVIPGNDDSSRAIRLYASGIADAVIEGRSQALQDIVRTGAEEDEFVEIDESPESA